MKIVIFGDSFANYDHCPNATLNWSHSLGQVLGLKVVNKGLSGTAINWSLNEFLKYVKSREYELDDIIIFVTSEDRRVWTKDMPPENSSFFHFSEDMIKRDAKWFEKNVEHLIWAYENLYHPSINHIQLTTLSFIQSWSLANPSNVVIALRGTGTEAGEWGFDDRVIQRVVRPQRNFFPFMQAES